MNGSSDPTVVAGRWRYHDDGAFFFVVGKILANGLGDQEKSRRVINPDVASGVWFLGKYCAQSKILKDSLRCFEILCILYA